jgi:PPOX class probable F420-dependent enzyme
VGIPASRLGPAALAFLAERHLATLSTLRPDGTPHAVPVGFTWDGERQLARVITSGDSRKADHARGGGPAAICQVDGRRWLTLEGTTEVWNDPDRVADAERRYAVRYRPPRVNPRRVVLVLRVHRALGSGEMLQTRAPAGTEDQP